MEVGEGQPPSPFSGSVGENSWASTGTQHPPPPLTLGEDSGAGRCHRHYAVATVITSEQDLRGSDLENMSLSRRFLKEGERGGVSRAQQGASGDQGLLRSKAASVCLAHCSPQGEEGGPQLSFLRVWLPTTHPTFTHAGALGPSAPLPNVLAWTRSFSYYLSVSQTIIKLVKTYPSRALFSQGPAYNQLTPPSHLCWWINELFLPGMRTHLVKAAAATQPCRSD